MTAAGLSGAKALSLRSPRRRFHRLRRATRSPGRRSTRRRRGVREVRINAMQGLFERGTRTSRSTRLVVRDCHRIPLLVGPEANVEVVARAPPRSHAADFFADSGTSASPPCRTDRALYERHSPRMPSVDRCPCTYCTARCRGFAKDGAPTRSHGGRQAGGGAPAPIVESRLRRIFAREGGAMEGRRRRSSLLACAAVSGCWPSAGVSAASRNGSCSGPRSSRSRSRSRPRSGSSSSTTSTRRCPARWFGSPPTLPGRP